MREALGRAGFDGSGSPAARLGSNPTWLQEERWAGDPPPHRQNWPNPDWSDVPRSERREQYRLGGALHRDRGQDVRSTGIGAMLADPETGELQSW